MKSKIIVEQVNAYRKNFLEHGDSPMGTFQNNIQTQYLRFEKLLEHFDLSCKFSIHDVGCGVCDFHKYLKRKNINHEYYGTEIVTEMIDFAKNKYPDLKIFKRDILRDKNIKKCDFVVLSGTLNLPGNIGSREWKKFSFELIKKMFELSNYGIAFNFLTSYNTFSSNSLAYFNPTEIFDFCMKNLSRFTLIDHAYPLYEGTITVFHNEYVKAHFTSKPFRKYF